VDEHQARHGVRLQVEMFDRKVYPDPTAAAAFADRARAVWPQSSELAGQCGLRRHTADPRPMSNSWFASLASLAAKP
jgi:hypothetical protein